MKKKIEWRKYHVRVCPPPINWKSQELVCEICGTTIRVGALYYDGGRNNMAHEVCVNRPSMDEFEKQKTFRKN